jgi:hypothetical protein
MSALMSFRTDNVGIGLNSTIVMRNVSIVNYSHCVPMRRCIRYSTSTSFVNGMTQS